MWHYTRSCTMSEARGFGWVYRWVYGSHIRQMNISAATANLPLNQSALNVLIHNFLMSCFSGCECCSLEPVFEEPLKDSIMRVQLPEVTSACGERETSGERGKRKEGNSRIFRFTSLNGEALFLPAFYWTKTNPESQSHHKEGCIALFVCSRKSM